MLCPMVGIHRGGMWPLILALVCLMSLASLKVVSSMAVMDTPRVHPPRLMLGSYVSAITWSGWAEGSVSAGAMRGMREEHDVGP